MKTFLSVILLVASTPLVSLADTNDVRVRARVNAGTRHNPNRPRRVESRARVRVEAGRRYNSSRPTRNTHHAERRYNTSRPHRSDTHIRARVDAGRRYDHSRARRDSVPAGRHYNPNRPHRNSVPAGRHYNPTRPHRDYYGSYRYHTPRNYRHRPYRRYYHSPYRTRYSHNIRYNYTRDYYRHLSYNNSSYIYINWILHPTSFHEGYVLIGNYPYFVYDGYQHRYSHYDYCSYELVDKFTHQVVMSFGSQACAYGYDECAYDRDSRNEMEYDNRYFCAERAY